MKTKRTFKDEVIRDSKDHRLTNRLNRFLSNNYVLPVLVVLYDLILFGLFNYVVNTIVKLIQASQGEVKNIFSLKNIFINAHLLSSTTIRYVYILFILLIVILDIALVYQVKTYWSMENINKEQKGKSRFTTIEEIKKQYKEIPDKEERYPGNAGTIISRYKDKLYIDTSHTNNLILGMTRSGKGEFFVYSSIDVYSRAENQASLIIADPKLELYRSSKKTLESRGYEVHLLNLIDPLSSMGYNPLTLIKEYYKKQRYDEAELMSDSFAFSVFNPGKAGNGGNEKFFDDTAAGVFSAMILSHIADCLKEDEIINAKRLEAYQEKRKAFDQEVKKDPDRREVLTSNYYYQRKLCKDNDVDEFTNTMVQYIPDEIEFYYSDKNEKCINIYSILNTLIELSQLGTENSDNTALDEYFRLRPPLDPGKMRYASALIAGDRTKGSILANTTQGLIVFTSKAIARMTAESTMDLRDIGFGDKPIAIFMGIPDYDRSKHFIPVSFIRQVYYYLAETCSRTTGKCKRHVKFIIDEFGNMPAIDDMENMITVCLGRNISFDLYIQDFSQLPRVYGDAGDTIEANCGNKIYILSNGTDSARKFSDLLGTKSIVSLQRTGHKMDLHKNFTEQVEEEPLMRPEDLLRLREGECVIVRSMKRKDKDGNDITPYPIFNSIDTNTRMKYRYEYLTDTFPNPDSINLADIIDESCKHIEPQKRIYDYNQSFDRYEEEKNAKLLFGKSERKLLSDLDDVKRNQITRILKESLEEDLEKVGVPEDGNIAIGRLIDLITHNNQIDKYRKSTLLGLLTGGENNEQ